MSSHSMTADLLTAADLAEILKVSEELVKRRTKADKWPCVKLSSKTIRYRPEHVELIVALYDHVEKVAPIKGLAGQTAASKARAS